MERNNFFDTHLDRKNDSQKITLSQKVNEAGLVVEEVSQIDTKRNLSGIAKYTIPDKNDGEILLDDIQRHQPKKEKKRSFLRIIGSAFKRLYSKEEQDERLTEYKKTSSRPFTCFRFFSVSNRAKLKTDTNGEVLDMENNRQGELLAMLKEISDDDLDLWKAIKHCSISTAKEWDSNIEERINIVVQHIIEHIGESQSDKVQIGEREKIFDWVGRVAVLLYTPQKRQRGEVK